MNKNGITGNPDVAPLYDPAVHPDVALRVNVVRAKHDPFMRGVSNLYVAERTRPGILTKHGVRGPQRVERITLNAPSVRDAIAPMREIARKYFEPSPIPWFIGERKFITGKGES